MGSESSVRWLESSSVQSSSTSSEFSLSSKTQSVRAGKRQKNFYGIRTWENTKCCTFTSRVTQIRTPLGHVHRFDPPTSRFIKSAVSFIRVPVIHFLLKLCLTSLLRFRRLMQPLSLSLASLSSSESVSVYSSDVAENDDDDSQQQRRRRRWGVVVSPKSTSVGQSRSPLS